MVLRIDIACKTHSLSESCDVSDGKKDASKQAKSSDKDILHFAHGSDDVSGYIAASTDGTFSSKILSKNARKAQLTEGSFSHGQLSLLREAFGNFQAHTPECDQTAPKIIRERRFATGEGSTSMQ